uniref:Transmembrane protein n=1 Tax=Heterorhabditis bacteriophora TaxID=37862 RepID=A0A1I7WM17_HETBA
MWTIVALILIKGIKYMGKLSYVTSTIPYIIITILFIRGITLDGASSGIYYYLGRPDFSKLLRFKIIHNTFFSIHFEEYSPCLDMGCSTNSDVLLDQYWLWRTHYISII